MQNNIFEIKFIGLERIIDLSYIFSCCSSLFSIVGLSSMKTSNITNIKNDFNG